MQAIILQARNFGEILITALAALKVQAERLRANKTGRIISWVILAALALTLWTIVTFRVAQRDAQARFEEWQTRFVDEFVSQQEAKEIGYPPDPKEELRKAENEAFARFIRTTARFNFSFDDYVTAAWGMDARTRNPIYPNTLLEVLEQKGQFPYDQSAEVTQADYKLAERVLDVVRSADHPIVSSDYVYASFETEGITLRDTWDISTKTHFWKVSQ